MELERLLVRRRVLKAQLTKLVHYLKNHPPATTLDLFTLFERQKYSESLFEQFLETQSEIECLDHEDGEDERELFENVYLKLIAEMKIVLSENM